MTKKERLIKSYQKWIDSVYIVEEAMLSIIYDNTTPCFKTAKEIDNMKIKRRDMEKALKNFSKSE